MAYKFLFFVLVIKIIANEKKKTPGTNGSINPIILKTNLFIENIITRRGNIDDNSNSSIILVTKGDWLEIASNK